MPAHTLHLANAGDGLPVIMGGYAIGLALACGLVVWLAARRSLRPRWAAIVGIAVVAPTVLPLLGASSLYGFFDRRFGGPGVVTTESMLHAWCWATAAVGYYAIALGALALAFRCGRGAAGAKAAWLLVVIVCAAPWSLWTQMMFSSNTSLLRWADGEVSLPPDLRWACVTSDGELQLRYGPQLGSATILAKSVDPGLRLRLIDHGAVVELVRPDGAVIASHGTGSRRSIGESPIGAQDDRQALPYEDFVPMTILGEANRREISLSASPFIGMGVQISDPDHEAPRWDRVGLVTPWISRRISHATVVSDTVVLFQMDGRGVFALDVHRSTIAHVANSSAWAIGREEHAQPSDQPADK